MDLHKRQKKLLWHLGEVGKYSLLPILVSIYPILFHDANNIGKMGWLPFTQMANLFTLLLLVGIGAYVIFTVLLRGEARFAAIAAFIFVILFNVYGIVYSWLYQLDFFPVDHYLFLPFFALFSVYLSWLVAKAISKKIARQFYTACLTVISILIVFNLVKIVPNEIKTIRASAPSTGSPSTSGQASTSQDDPDIYFLIFDEYAGFDAMRGYWKYEAIDSFDTYLKSKGFFVAENSHAAVPSTLPEIASRLNYETIPAADGGTQPYYDAIKDNKVMAFLKQRGYTTVVVNGLYYAWSTQQTITSDYTFKPAETYTGGYLNTEFEILVLKNTMVLPFLYNQKQDDPVATRNRSMLYYTVSELPKLSQLPGPRFIYIHLMLPHAPFLFDAKGNPLDPQYYWDWDYYLGNYIYATAFIHDMVNSILDASDPTRPPVIILQSDHGARNGPDNYTKYLQNYPEEYRTLIMNALYLPGCDTSGLAQDMNPVDTFPVVFNCYFGTDLPTK